MSKPKFSYTCYPDNIMRKINLISYDSNKYCLVKFLNMNTLPKGIEYETGFLSIKADYIHRTKMKRNLYHKTLCRWFGLESIDNDINVGQHVMPLPQELFNRFDAIEEQINFIYNED